MSNKNLLATRVPESMHEALRGVQEATGISMGEMTRRALSAYFAEGGGWEDAKERADKEFAERTARLEAIDRLPALISKVLEENEQFPSRKRQGQ